MEDHEGFNTFLYSLDNFFISIGISFIEYQSIDFLVDFFWMKCIKWLIFDFCQKYDFFIMCRAAQNWKLDSVLHFNIKNLMKNCIFSKEKVYKPPWKTWILFHVSSSNTSFFQFTIYLFKIIQEERLFLFCICIIQS